MATNSPTEDKSTEIPQSKPCDCKGIRTCLVCENVKGSKLMPLINNPSKFYTICANCGVLQKSDVSNEISLFCEGKICKFPSKTELLISNLMVEGIILDGIHLVKDFLSESEESEIVSVIDSIDWKNSQSGRRKQNYGPKINFKRKKIKLGDFSGLPPYAETLVGRINSLKTFNAFKPVEFCNLEYSAENGASIDPHFDDKWVWGDRLISISTLSDSVITFFSQDLSVQVALPLPRRSFLGFWGSSRYF